MTTRRARYAVIVLAAIATILKLEIAAHTFGTNDVHYWIRFARTVRSFGPVGIYGRPLVGAPVYNHGPLSGWLLVAVNWLHDRGVAGYPFLIRAPACLADLATAVLVFELVRARRPVRQAATAAVLVVFSPVLLVISGFHGNTDPLMVMLLLLGVWLLVVRRSPLAAGIAYALSVSVKLVPIVAAGVLLVVAVRAGRRALAAFVAGGAIVFGLLWVPVLLGPWNDFRHNVLGYRGIPARQWGLVQFLAWAHLPNEAARLAGDGRIAVLLLSALVAAAVVWRRPDAAVPAAGLSLVLFLLLSPAYGMQYLSWALAAAYLIGLRSATVYNLAASAFVVAVYDHWNGARPWHWHEAHAREFWRRELALMVLTWASLALVATVGIVSTRPAARPLPAPSSRGS